MKKIRKIICFALVFSLFCLTNVKAEPVIYTGDDINLMYDNMTAIGVNLSRSGSTAICSSDVIMSANKKLEIEMTLQRSKDNGYYAQYAQWTKEFTGKGDKIFEKTKAITKGYTYRLRVVVKIYSGTTLDEATAVYSKTFNY